MAWFRIIAVAIAITFVVPITAPQAPLIGVPDASAQERRQGGGLFRSLRRVFGDSFPDRQIRRAIPRQRGNNGIRVIRPNAAQTVVVAPKQKAVDAKIALVLGDGTASQLSAGLVSAFSQSATLRIADRSRNNVGLVNDTAPGMSAMASAFVNGAKKFDYIIVLVGQHDRLAITDTDGETYDFRQDGWAELYSARVEQLALTLLGSGKPVFWMGLPPVRDEITSGDLAYLNDIYDASLARVGARFIDVWDGFVSAEGQFLQEGPDHTGQIRALRSQDGNGFTAAGQRKLAFYVESRLKRLVKEAEQLAGDTGLENNPLLLTNFDNPSERPEIWEVALTGNVAPRRNLTLAGGSAAESATAEDAEEPTSVVSDDAPLLRADNFEWGGRR